MHFECVIKIITLNDYIFIEIIDTVDMILNLLKPRKALNKAFLKVTTKRSEIECFKTNLLQLLDRINESETEEFHKNLVSDFLKKTYYEPNHFINTKGRNDLVIHNGNSADTTVGVIVEAKKPKNKAEMISKDNLNAKAFQELVLYYLRERITLNNLEIKHLVATNINEWFIFDVSVFERLFAQNKKLVHQFTEFEGGRLADVKTDFFYKQIAEPFIAEIKQEIEFTYFNIQEFQKPLKNTDKADDNQLIALYKLLTPEHLLKLPFVNDSNSLDKRFYSELLHIIGLVETKEGGKKVIQRNKAGERNTGTLLEDAIVQLDSLDKLSRLDKPSQFGANTEERLFNVALELSITWINRILFLKLLEAQLISYHKGDKSYSFLNIEKIRNYDDLNSLFFQVLAKRFEERNEDVKKLFDKVPYLNSSLFEPTDLEHTTLFISNLKDDKEIPIIGTTKLTDGQGNKLKGKLAPLDYLFKFLDAYNFSSEGAEAIQEENKTLINASVLGLIFEKINGYKDGSFFTPGFITMYMCKETIRKAVLQKFNETKQWNCESIDALYDKIEDRKEANDIVNSLKICDPAVGSGHFLVSALNEVISIKNDLKILQDRDGKRLKEYTIEVVNDELTVTDDDGQLFEYRPNNAESQRIQETLFYEKQTIIENCLFGVDINPNSVKICRLRLWIELLKNAYYKNTKELETLPNIDINIKCGNSLVSRFAIDADLSQALKNIKYDIKTYRKYVSDYKACKDRTVKKELQKIINGIKGDFRTEIFNNDPKKTRLAKLAYELYNRFSNNTLFEPDVLYGKEDKKLIKKRKEEQCKIEEEISKLKNEIELIENNIIYRDAFEWRFEFPEVLNNEGEFIGFDVVIGNPPYFSFSKIKEQGNYFAKAGYKTYSKSTDIYCLFYERGNQILNSNGLLTYITSNSWLRVIYGELLKKYLAEETQPITLLNIEDTQIFEEATVESNILSLQKGKGEKPFYVCGIGKDYEVGASLSEYFNQKRFECDLKLNPEWIIGNEKTGNLKLKIEKGSILLKDFNYPINYGIKTGYNDAFVIDEKTRTKFINNDPKCDKILKPILRGRDIEKYGYKFGNCYIINTHNGIKQMNIERINVERDYPIIHKHLSTFLPKVEQRQDKGDDWTNLRNCAYLKDFEKPKIIWGELSDKQKFAYDESGMYANNTIFFIVGKDIKYLLAILNSKIAMWYFNQISTSSGMGTNRWLKYKIEQLPIKDISEEEQLPFVEIVDKILLGKKNREETSILEDEIDQMVYKLYDLTEEEIRIVEGK